MTHKYLFLEIRPTEEVDFVVRKEGQTKQLIQVCYDSKIGRRRIGKSGIIESKQRTWMQKIFLFLQRFSK